MAYLSQSSSSRKSRRSNWRGLAGGFRKAPALQAAQPAVGGRSRRSRSRAWDHAVTPRGISSPGGDSLLDSHFSAAFFFIFRRRKGGSEHSDEQREKSTGLKKTTGENVEKAEAKQRRGDARGGRGGNGEKACEARRSQVAPSCRTYLPGSSALHPFGHSTV